MQRQRQRQVLPLRFIQCKLRLNQIPQGHAFAFTSSMKSTTEAIIEFNRGRDPERLALKLRALRSDPFAFFRGTAPLFYSTIDMPRTLRKAPLGLCCGDLHLENFGSYKGDNRLVYFDLNHFDEACIAPLGYDLLRFTSSILLAAKSLKIEPKQALRSAALFIDT